MNYSKFGIGMMILFSLTGLYVAFFISGLFPMILGLTIFLLCTFVWVESVYSEFKYRKKEKQRRVKITKELRKFLIKKHVLNEFKTNVQTNNLSNYSCYDSIITSFRWKITKEGYEFWYNLHKEFEKTKVKEEN